MTQADKTQPSSTEDMSQEDLRVLLDNAPDAIARFDPELRHVYVNGATARENNRPTGDFRGKTMEDLGHHPKVCAFINSNLRAVFASGKERTRELLFEGPLGSKWFQCRMAPEFDVHGAVESVLVISRDISEQRQAEEKLRETESRAANAALARELAHEINNPLTAVLYAIELLQHSSSLDDEARRVLAIADENVHRVSEISKKLLGLYGSPAVDGSGEENS